MLAAVFHLLTITARGSGYPAPSCLDEAFRYAAMTERAARCALFEGPPVLTMSNIVIEFGMSAVGIRFRKNGEVNGAVRPKNAVAWVYG